MLPSSPEAPLPVENEIAKWAFAISLLSLLGTPMVGSGVNTLPLLFSAIPIFRFLFQRGRWKSHALGVGSAVLSLIGFAASVPAPRALNPPSRAIKERIRFSPAASKSRRGSDDPGAFKVHGVHSS